METPELLEQVLNSDAGSDCRFHPLNTGPTIRVIFNAPYRGVDALTGEFVNTAPTAHARTIDVAGVVPEVSLMRIESLDYVAERLEKLGGHGDQWRVLMLRRMDV